MANWNERFWRFNSLLISLRSRLSSRLALSSTKQVCLVSKMPSSVSNSPTKSCIHSSVPSPAKRHMSNSTESAPVLLFKKLTANAFAPTKGSKCAAGYDLYSAYDVVVPSKGKALIKTDIQIQLPHGCYGRVAPRSGLAVKNFIDVGAGVVDEDYRGNVGVVLFNFGDEDFNVAKGDRVAQLICERIYYPEIKEVDNLTDTERGHGGYGSTGTN